jgi:hypothetical protein
VKGAIFSILIALSHEGFGDFMSIYEDVSKQAQAFGWDNVLATIIPDFKEALANHKHIDCPIHGGKQDFRFPRNFSVKGIAICTCKNRHVYDLLVDMDVCANRFEAAKLVKSVIEPHAETINKRTFDFEKQEKERLERENSPKIMAKRYEKLMNIWNAALPLDHVDSVIAWKYLTGRGLTLIRQLMSNDSLRFHPALPYYNDNVLIGHFPAIVGLCSQPAMYKANALHATYLTEEGKKLSTLVPFAVDKKTLIVIDKRSSEGRHLPIYEPSECDTLNVAEGIETAFAVASITAETTHATINADLLTKLVVTDPNIKKVRIWADKDRSQAGQNSATTAVQRALVHGLEVEVMIPKQEIPESSKGIDWLDVWNLQPAEVKSLLPWQRLDHFQQLADEIGLEISA